MSYFDSTLRAGYYGAVGVNMIGHAYAILERSGEEWAFPCFGGVARREDDFGHHRVRYPVDLWTPYMIGSTNVGSQLPANLFVALGMAQFTPAPRFNYRLDKWAESWKTVPGSSSCWSGIVYGVSGVCQQACNRVLWSTRQDRFTECPVNWPPSFSGAYWVYGYYGKTSEGIAVLLAQMLVAIARATQHSMHLSAAAPRTAMSRGAESVAAPSGREAELRQALGRELRRSLTDREAVEGRQQYVAQLLAKAPAGEPIAAATTPMSGVIAPDQKFLALKTELDKQLLRGEVSHDEYAHEVNGAYSVMVEELQNVLPVETFRAFFPEGAGSALIIREQMPSSYEAIQSVAGV